MTPRRDELAHVRLLACDVDGVLTDGSLHYGPDGELANTFHVRDGLGLRRVIDAGIEVALISARPARAIGHRALELGIRRVIEGRHDKAAVLAELAGELGIEVSAALYVGDDVLDVPAMRAAGLSAAPSDAHPEARAVASWITRAAGGRGAVREIADAIVASRSPAAEFRVVIPSRWLATRLPGKPLASIAGEPMIAHVWRRAMESGASEVIVACDDERIVAAVEALGGRAVLTSPEHASGTDRIAEVAEREGWPDDATVVNLQGDEPSMPPALVRAVADALREEPTAGIATLATPIHDPAELFRPDVVKVVLDDAGFARWFSRAPIPWVRGAFDAGPPAALPEGVCFLRHLGIYAYRVHVLRALCRIAPGGHERAESLEQLRALGHGLAIVCRTVDDPPAGSIDTPSDLERVQREFSERGRPGPARSAARDRRRPGGRSVE